MSDKPTPLEQIREHVEAADRELYLAVAVVEQDLGESTDAAFLARATTVAAAADQVVRKAKEIADRLRTLPPAGGATK